MTAQAKGHYWSTLLAALLGRAGVASGHEVPAVAPADLEARIAGMELEVRERDERITRMRAEYEQLQLVRERAGTDGGQSELERLFKRLAGPWATLLAAAALADAGQAVQAGDMAQLVRDVEKVLARAGLEPIGRAGEHTVFDVAAHQRMSGGSVTEGTSVTVRVPGFRMGGKVLVKAMVSTREA